MPGNHHILAFTSCTDDIPIWAVALAMLLLFLPAKSASCSCGEPILKPAANNSSTWYHYQQIFTVLPAKTRKSCQCWHIALIQWQWDNAWDLTTHWNIESPVAGLWPSLLRLLCLTPTAKAPAYRNGPVHASYQITFSGKTLTHYSNKCVRPLDSTCNPRVPALTTWHAVYPPHQHARLFCTHGADHGEARWH